jgi:phosphoribosylformylglycinamidine synthase subunit PurS
VNTYTAEVRITPRAGLLDPEGQAIQHALRSLDFDEVEDARVGRLLLLRVLADSEAAAERSTEAMCRKLLANPVTEDFHIAIRKGE